MKKRVLASLFSATLLLSLVAVPAVVSADQGVNGYVDLLEDECEPDIPDDGSDPIDEPEEPTEPSEPVEEPDEPEEPTEPSEPVEEPDKPEEPTEPSEPVEEPEEPEEPTEPSKPVEEPDESKVPSKPSGSVEKSDESTKVSDSSKDFSESEVSEEDADKEEGSNSESVDLKNDRDEKIVVKSESAKADDSKKVDQVSEKKSVKIGDVESSGEWQGNSPEDIDIQDGDTEYEIQWGDTLSAISVKSGISIDELVEMNDIVDPDLIYAGSILALK